MDVGDVSARGHIRGQTPPPPSDFSGTANRGLSLITLGVRCQLGNQFAERSLMNMSTCRFFQLALWTPAALLLSLPFLEVLSRGKISLEDMLVSYGLWFGTLAYLIFAAWTTWFIKKRTESAVVRLVWWAPLIFIPFYGIPWIAYGLFHVAMGDMSGFAMAILWVAFSPYIIVAGYVCVAVTFVFYHMFFKSPDSECKR